MGRRDGGGGIGISSHKGSYRRGVRISNWVEDIYGVELADSKEGDEKVKFTATTTQRASFVDPAELGAERTEKIMPEPGLEKDILFGHGTEMRKKYDARLSDLVYSKPSNTSLPVRDCISGLNGKLKVESAPGNYTLTTRYQANVRAETTANPFMSQSMRTYVGVKGELPNQQMHFQSGSMVPGQARGTSKGELMSDYDSIHHKLGLRTGYDAYRSPLLTGPETT